LWDVECNNLETMGGHVNRILTGKAPDGQAPAEAYVMSEDTLMILAVRALCER
jgi:hypothetical protein